MSDEANGGPTDDTRRALKAERDGWAVVSYLIAGVGFWGFAGWLLDRWLETRFMVMIGVFVGFAGAFYLIIRRFGKG